MDTESTHSYLGIRFLELLEPYKIPLENINTEKLIVANGKSVKISLPVKIGHKEEIMIFRIVPSLRCKAILGIDMIRKTGMIMDFKENNWWLNDLPQVY